MTDKPFMRNELLRRDDGTRHRLLAFEVDADTSWLIAMDTPLALPFEARYSRLPQWFERIDATTSTSPEAQPTMKALPKPPSAASILLSERAMKRIAPLVDNPAIFDRNERNKLLEQRSEELIALGDHGTPKTLLKHLRAFWRGGQTQDALLGNFENCGRPETAGTAGRGRKRANESAAFQVKPEDQASMRDVIETFYFDLKHKRTLTAALQELHERHYTYLDGNNVRCLRPAHEAPSYRQLEYFLKERYSLEDRIRARLGDKAFEKDHRSTEGSVQIDCHGVGHIYEFDATIADVILVSSADRAAIVGKPTLYLIIDRASRLIVGWYAGFENASYTAAMEAILSIGEDKEALCEFLDIPYDPADWPAHGILPESFIADQGELTSKKARRIARSLRCMLTNVPGLRPDWKPLVECGFAMLHQIISPHAPGYAPDADNRQRRAIKHDKDSALNLKEFTSLIVKAIIAHNKTMQVGYPLTISQVADEVPPIPRELWAHGVRRRMGKLDRMDFERVRAELMPRSTATITGDGLVFEDVFYSCPEAEARGWLVAGRRQRKPLEVAFDYRLVDEIVVFSPDGSGESFIATLHKDSVIFRGMAFADVKRHKAAEAKLKAPADEVKRQNRYEYNQHAKQVKARAKADTKEATQGVSYAGRKKNSAQARAADLAAERTRIAGVVAPAVATVPTSSPVASASQPLAPVIPLNRGSNEAAPAPAVPTPPRPMGLKERMAAARKQMEG